MEDVNSVFLAPSLHGGDEKNDIAVPLIMETKTNPRFVGLIMAFILPGSAHVFSGHWKTGIAWYCTCSLLFFLCTLILVLPVPLSFATVIAAQLSVVIFSVILFISSYRPTRLRPEGWIIFLCLAFAINIVEYMVSPSFTGPFGEIRTSACLYPSNSSREPAANVVVVNRQTYRSSDPRRGDIIGFVNGNDGFLWVNRIAGLPGETVDIQHPYVLINGERLLDPSISLSGNGYSDYDSAEDMELERIALPITLGSDEYFVLGDISAESLDSRYLECHIGPVSRAAIQGKVIRIVFPPWRIREL